MNRRQETTAWSSGSWMEGWRSIQNCCCCWPEIRGIRIRIRLLDWFGFGSVWFGYRLRTFSAMVGQLQSQPEVDDVQNENVSGWEEEGSKRSARHHSQI